MRTDMAEEIDAVDFSILTCIGTEEGPLWKNKIHECIEARADELPIPEPVSVQTVGRRVDRLNQDGYLDNAIVSPESLKRDLIIAFDLTEKGETAIRSMRTTLLRDAARREIFAAERVEGLSKAALIRLMQEEFGLDDDICQRMEADYSRDELVMLLGMHFAEQQATDIFDDDKLRALRDTMADQETIIDMVKRG